MTRHPIIVLEAMKMEHIVKAPADRVAAISVSHRRSGGVRTVRWPWSVLEKLRDPGGTGLSGHAGRSACRSRTT